jgi:hypothetical protein
MKIQTTPLLKLRERVREHLKKKSGDDEATTMLAIRPLLVEQFGAAQAAPLFHQGVFHAVFMEAFTTRLPTHDKLKQQPKAVIPLEIL